MKKVVIGLIGVQLDQRGAGEERWNRWRPTVSLCQHEEIMWDRMEILSEKYHAGLVAAVKKDVAQISPETELREHVVNFSGDAWDFEKVYGALFDWAKGYAFDEENEEYFVHITTGTHVAQICLFLLTEAGFLPAKLIQTSPPIGRESKPRYDVIDLDLSKYDKLNTRFTEERMVRRDFQLIAGPLKNCYCKAHFAPN